MTIGDVITLNDKSYKLSEPDTDLSCNGCAFYNRESLKICQSHATQACVDVGSWAIWKEVNVLPTST